eukprot:296510-Chlamydomonas_euryale.AAC.1
MFCLLPRPAICHRIALHRIAFSLLPAAACQVFHRKLPGSCCAPSWTASCSLAPHPRSLTGSNARRWPGSTARCRHVLWGLIARGVARGVGR